MTSDPGDSGVIEREIFIAAGPETVFRFFVDPVFMARWIGLFHRLEPRPGGLFEIEISSGNVARGIYTEVTPPRRVAFTWGWESPQLPELASLPPGASLVEIELEPKDGGTLLHLRHSRLKTTSWIHRQRWSAHLERLAAVVREHPPQPT